MTKQLKASSIAGGFEDLTNYLRKNHQSAKRMARRTHTQKCDSRNKIIATMIAHVSI